MTAIDDFERSLGAGLTGLAPVPAGDLAARVMAVVDATEQVDRWGLGWRRPGLLLAAAVVAVALLGAAVVGSGLLRIPDVAPTPPPAPAESEPAQSDVALPSGSPGSSPAISPEGAHTVALTPMAEARALHGAIRLTDGRVLVGGGMGMTENEVDSIEVWDPETGEFSAFGTLPEPMPGVGALTRSGLELILLPSGEAIVIPGGCHCSPVAPDAAVIIDPRSRSARVAPGLMLARDGATATLLDDGRILVVGGTPEPVTGSTATAELWEPETERIAAVGSMATDRTEHSATLLADGTVLVVGGANSPPGPGLMQPLDTSEIWDPETGTFSAVPSLDGFNGQAITLGDGLVLLLPRADRLDLGSDPVAASLWDPASATLTPVGSLDTPRVGYTATLLPDDSVLIVGGLEYVGGEAYVGDPVLQIERWDPESRSFLDAGTLLEGRYNHSATALLDGSVLIVGGLAGAAEGVTLLSSAERWIGASP